MNGYNPFPEDLRQMYVYHEYFSAEKVALVYPSDTNDNSQGKYFDKLGIEDEGKQCSVVSLKVEKDVRKWQGCINDHIKKFVN